MFPTEVKNGELIIHVGSNLVKVPFKFLTEDFGYDNTEFPMCNVMCYLRNENGMVIMRFDGTVTKFDNDMRVTGFSHFDKEDIYQHTQYLPIGTVGHFSTKGISQHTLCTIYSVPDSNTYVLECLGDPEPIEFTPEENPKFADDLSKGTRYFPRLIKKETNVYSNDKGEYTVVGTPLKTTGYVSM
jgi:hypothetical protein